MPVGPLAVTDEVTLELQYNVVRQAERTSGRIPGTGLLDGASVRRGPEAFGPAVRRRVLRLPGRRPKVLWRARVGVSAGGGTARCSRGRHRLLYIQALETARCMEEGVLRSAHEADLGSILGWGFPAYTGGTLSFIDTIGVREVRRRLQAPREASRPAIQAFTLAARARGSRRDIPRRANVARGLNARGAVQRNFGPVMQIAWVVRRPGGRDRALDSGHECRAFLRVRARPFLGTALPRHSITRRYDRCARVFG